MAVGCTVGSGVFSAGVDVAAVGASVAIGFSGSSLAWVAVGLGVLVAAGVLVAFCPGVSVAAGV